MNGERTPRRLIGSLDLITITQELHHPVMSSAKASELTVGSVRAQIARAVKCFFNMRGSLGRAEVI